MNPALVSTIQKSNTILLIKGVAKAGLIKQRGGKKAAERIAELLEQAFQK